MEWYNIVMHDLRKRVVGKLDLPELREEPKYNFTIGGYDAFDRLNDAEGLVMCDVETRRGRIACIGFGWSPLDAICIPLMHVDGTRYWPEAKERVLCLGIREFMERRGFILGNQNFNYDRQYFAADPAFGFVPRCDFDTMIAQHLLYPGTEKSLAHLSSMYCAHHRFWKDEGKEILTEVDEDRWWYYNCLDCVKTVEVAQVQRPMLQRAGFL
jgi:hypothetical protein